MLSKFLLCVVFLGAVSPIYAQDFGGKQSFGVSATYSPNSSHILIGEAQQRRTWTGGIDYARRIWSSDFFRLNYEASLIPFFQERDPIFLGNALAGSSTPVITPWRPYRVVYVSKAPIGPILAGVAYHPIYSRVHTHAVAATPLGLRLNANRRHRLQPLLSMDGGVVYAPNELPVDDSGHVNFLVSFGGGAEFFRDKKSSVRFEYLLRHISNAYMVRDNPGIDSWVFRLTLTRYR